MKTSIIKSKKFNWFTLVELIIIIVILSILYGISMSYYKNYLSNTRDVNRVEDIKKIAAWIEIFSIQAQKYPLSNNNLKVTWISNQGYFSKNISELLKFSKNPVDPKDQNLYIYTTNISQNKYQLWAYLEEKNDLFFTTKNTFANNYNYENRYLYSYWNKIWIIVNSETNLPINEKYSSWEINIGDLNDYFKVYFSNSNSNSWTISWSWENLKNSIKSIQNSCIYWENLIYSWKSLIIKKIITNWTSNIEVSCLDWKISFWEEIIDCWEFIYDENLKTCNENKCIWELPLNTQLNWIQKYNISWKYNTTPWDCNYVCKSWYFWNNWICKISDIGYYVEESWSEKQQECNQNDKFQDKQWQSKCEDVLLWYYSIPQWNLPHLWQKICEENNYCENWIKYTCPYWTNSILWSKSINDCVLNKINVIFNLNWWESVSFWSKNVDYNTQIWDLPIANRNWYNFNWWFSQSSWWVKISTSEIITTDITFYAQWIQKINWVCWSTAWTCSAWTVSNFNNTSTPWAYKTWICNWINWWINISCSKQNSRTYSWVTWWWWTCSNSCWSWTQYRTVYCRRYDWTTVSDAYCWWWKPATSQWCSGSNTCKRVKTWWGWEFACWHYLWTSCSPYWSTMWAQSSWTTCLMTCK